MELIRARARHGDNSTTGRTAELSLIATGFDVYLLIEVEWNGVAADERTEVRYVHAVDIVNVFSNRGAGNRYFVTKSGIARRGAWSQKLNARQVTCDRQTIKRFLNINGNTGRGPIKINRSRSRTHDDNVAKVGSSSSRTARRCNGKFIS